MRPPASDRQHPARQQRAGVPAAERRAGPFLRCMPDGETGERSRWVYFQRQMLLDHPAMEIDPTVPPYKFVQWDGKVVREIEQVRFKPGVDPRPSLSRRVTTRPPSPPGRCSRTFVPPARSAPCASRSPADAAGQRLPLCQRAGARDLLRGLRAGAEIGAGQYREGDPGGRPLDPVGCLPGGAGLRGLLQGSPGALQEADLRHAGAAGRCRAGRRRDGLSPVLRLAARRALGSAQGRRHPGRDDERHRRRHQRPIDFLHIPVPKDRTDDAFYAPLKDFKAPPGG